MASSVFRTFQVVFSGGRLSERISARSDTRVYYIGCQKYRNWLSTVQGTARNRPGSLFKRMIETSGTDIIDAANRVEVQMLEFTVRDNDRFMLILDMENFKTYDINRDNYQEHASSPYSNSQIPFVRYAQRGDLSFFSHPDHMLQQFARTGFSSPTSTFTLSDFAFDIPPQYKYHADGKTTLQASGTSGSVTITAQGGTDNNVFVADSVGEVWTLAGVDFLITARASNTEVTATLNGTLANTDATLRWTEQAHGEAKNKGYYRAVAIHSGRLVLGGTKAAPFVIWLSRIGSIGDFLESLDEPVDDDPCRVEAEDAINHIVSGPAGIEVYTNKRENLIPSAFNSPITPSSISILKQTSVQASDRVAPVELEAQTVFLSRNRKSVREFVFSETEEAFRSIPLTIRAEDIVTNVVGMASVTEPFGLDGSFLFLVERDGSLSVLTSDRSQQVTAWAKWDTSLPFHAVQTSGNRVFALITNIKNELDLQSLDRQTYGLVEFTYDAIFDAEKTVVPNTATSFLYDLGVAPFAGVVVTSDDTDADPFPPGEQFYAGEASSPFLSTTFLLPDNVAASELRVGLPYTYELAPMNETIQGERSVGTSRRLIYADIEYMRSANLQMNGRVIPDRAFDGLVDNPLPDEQTTVFRVSELGYKKDGPLVTLTGQAPFPAEIKAISERVRFNSR